MKMEVPSANHSTKITWDSLENMTTDFLTDLVNDSSITGQLDVQTIRRSDVEIVLNSLIFLVLFITGVFGNFLVILAIYGSSHLRGQMSNILIVNLSITDIISALAVMSTSFMAVALDIDYINPIWCNTCCALNYICIIVSMLTLAFISIDRYVAIIHALSYSTIISKEKLWFMVGYTWLQGTAFAAAPALLDWVHYDYWEAICAIDWHQEKTQALYYVIIACIICFLVPGLIMTVAYTFIIREARKVSAVMPQTASNNNRQQQQQQDPAARGAAKTIQSLLIVVLFFFICMTPFSITKLLKVIFEDKHAVPTYVNLIASYFQFVSSVVNPFIYGLFRKDFRRAYKRIIEKITGRGSAENNFSMTISNTE